MNDFILQIKCPECGHKFWDEEPIMCPKCGSEVNDEDIIDQTNL